MLPCQHPRLFNRLVSVSAMVSVTIFIMATRKQENQHDGGVALQEAKPKIAQPPLYKVMLMNDDYTPMEFVVQVLQTFFTMPREKAVQVMLQVHTQGSGVCGVFAREVAETKVEQVNEFSRHHQHPLLCTMEKA